MNTNRKRIALALAAVALFTVVAASLILGATQAAAADAARAGGWIADYHSGRRAGDALHLAVCMRLSATLCTADDTLARAADKVGVAVQRVA